jgi:nucleotide-binding universal stress UspA family protein
LVIREGVGAASGPADVLGVVHVLPSPRALDAVCPGHSHDRAELVARASKAIEERVHRFSDRRPEVFIEDGTDYAAIASRAERWKADVIVVGSHGRSGFARVVGGVAEDVVRSAHCSVLVVRACASHGWVLAATDLSTPSLPAITAGATEARRRHAQLEVVGAVGFLELEARYLVQLSMPSVEPPMDVLTIAEQQLCECVARLHVDATCKVLDRPAAAAILSEADAIRAELLVVGSRGGSGVLRRAPGRVAEKIVHSAVCSVLVVRTDLYENLYEIGEEPSLVGQADPERARP